MKTLWKISTFTLLLFTLTACMPDSLTKFKESATKKADDVTFSGGSGDDDDDTVETCSPGTDPACTSPGTFSYPDDKNYKFLLNEDGEDFVLPTIAPSFSNFIEGHDEYLTLTSPENFATDTGLTINFEDEAQFIGTPDRFLPKTFYEVTATYSTPEFASDEVHTDTFAMTIAQDLESVIFPMSVGDMIILEVDDVSPFSTVTGYNSISAENGVSGQVTYIDSENKEIHITITENTGKGYFSVDQEVDNSSAFFNRKATVSASYRTFGRTTSIQEGFNPIVTGYDSLTSKEVSSLSYSIFPSLPAGLSFDQMRGTIGTLRAYQNITDGDLSVQEGSREITGVGTLFLSHLQVNSTVKINGELHKIESIESNSSAKTYTPFSSTATVSDFDKILKGSVELTNGSAFITGVGTSFSSEVITGKSIIIDAVSDFTGLTSVTGSIDTVISDTSISLNSNFSGTALTIPEVKATNYVITAKNILGKTVTRLVTISLLDIIQPKTLTKVAYNLAVGDKVVLYVEDTTSFSKDGYISNRNGTIAQIDFINETDKKILATVRNIGKYCTVSTALTSTACSNANGTWLDKNFDNEDSVDNSSSYLSGETTLTNSSVLSFSISSTAISRTPVVSPGLTTAELETLEYSIEPDISSGQGFCATNPNLTNKFDCNNAVADDWSQGLLFATFDQCSDTTFTTEATCIGSDVWIKKGSFYGAPTTTVPETTFTVTTTTLLDKTVDSELKISVGAPPEGLSLARNLLLHVPSAAAFDIGDAITSRSGGLGTVTGKFSINLANTEKDTFEYEYLEVKLIKGTFVENEDIDNIPNFYSQKTYIIGGGVYKYNVKLNVTNSDDFKDKEYVNYSSKENIIQVGADERARVIFNDETYDTLYVTVYDTKTYTFNTEPNPISTNDTITAPNISPIPSEAIQSIEGTNLKLTFDTTAYLGLSSNSKGHDITSSGTGIGMLHYFGSSTEMNIEVTEGTFEVGDDLDSVSPHSGDATQSITEVNNDYTLYFYRGIEGTVDVTLDISDENTLIEIDKELPEGLTAEENSLGVYRITGIPTSPSSKEKFTLTATNAFGATTYEFFIKVYDQFNLVDTTGSQFYILHKTGKGNGRRPCSVTEEQMLYGDSSVKDITCFLDAGEDDLHWNGIKLQIQMGENLCQFVDENPTAFWKFPPGSALSTLGSTGTNDLPNDVIYKHAGYSSCTTGTIPDGEYSTDSNGQNLISGITHARLLLAVQEPKDLCLYNYASQKKDADYPECDTAELPISEITWTPEEFLCTAEPSLGSASECESNYGSCSGGTSDGSEGTEADCDAESGTWTPDNNIHNDPSYATGYSGATAVGTCNASAAEVKDPVECGGERYACLAGARTSWTSVENEDIIDGVSGVRHNTIADSGDPITSIDIDYTKSYSGSDYSTNVWYSNYHSQCSVDTYKPDVASFETSISSRNASSSTYGAGASSTYLYECKTAAGANRAKIRLVVRDFDRDIKVKFGFCDNASYTNKSDCVGAGDIWAQSGIDYFNPDSLSHVGAADPLNFLFNTQTDDFSDNYNTYNNQQDFSDSSSCAGQSFDFDPAAPVLRHPEDNL